MTTDKNHTNLLAALATLAAIAAGLLYLVLDLQRPPEGYQGSLKRLTNDVLPSLIATLLATAFAVLFARRLDRRRAHEVKARDLSSGVLTLNGSWHLRDWRHDYADDFELRTPKSEASEDSSWFRAREAFCKTKEYKDRQWKHSENVRIDQVGDSVEVYFSHRDRDRRSQVHYRIDGRIVGKTFIGEWKEIRAKNDAYWFGAVQLHVDEGDRETGKTMLGRWTGTHSRGGTIRSGIWEFIETTKGKRKPTWPSGIDDEKLGSRIVDEE